MASIDAQHREQLAPLFEEQLSASALYRDGWLDRGPVRAMFEGHRRSERDHTDVLWPVFELGGWFEARAGIR